MCSTCYFFGAEFIRPAPALISALTAFFGGFEIGGRPFGGIGGGGMSVGGFGGGVGVGRFSGRRIGSGRITAGSQNPRVPQPHQKLKGRMEKLLVRPKKYHHRHWGHKHWHPSS